MFLLKRAFPFSASFGVLAFRPENNLALLFFRITLGRCWGRNHE